MKKSVDLEKLERSVIKMVKNYLKENNLDNEFTVNILKNHRIGYDYPSDIFGYNITSVNLKFKTSTYMILNLHFTSDDKYYSDFFICSDSSYLGRKEFFENKIKSFY